MSLESGWNRMMPIEVGRKRFGPRIQCGEMNREGGKSLLTFKISSPGILYHSKDP